MEIECPYCGTAHLLDLGGNRPAVLIKLHCLMCGGRLELPRQRPGRRQKPPRPIDNSYPGISGALPITLHGIRRLDAEHWSPTGAVYDKRLGTWTPYTGSPIGREIPSTIRSIIRRSVGLSDSIQNWRPEEDE